MKPSHPSIRAGAANVPESARRAALEAAEKKAYALFDAIENEGLIAPGRTEREIELDIFKLAHERFGIEKHWHKRIVRTGANTVTTAIDRPPIRTVEPEDTVYVDLGPVVEDWEADVGRTYVLGSSAEKQKLVDDLERVFTRVQQHVRATPDITGAEVYAFARKAAEDAGWEFGGVVAGHIVSEFPHAWLTDAKDVSLIWPKNPSRLCNPDGNGQKRHWILEIHLVDRARTFGGFYERLL